MAPPPRCRIETHDRASGCDQVVAEAEFRGLGLLPIPSVEAPPFILNWEYQRQLDWRVVKKWAALSKAAAFAAKFRQSLSASLSGYALTTMTIAGGQSAALSPSGSATGQRKCDGRVRTPGHSPRPKAWFDRSVSDAVLPLVIPIRAFPTSFMSPLGFMDAHEKFAPQAQAYWEIRLPFVVMDDGLPRVQGYTRQRNPSIGNPRDRR
jgi:hypothetical protein